MQKCKFSKVQNGHKCKSLFLFFSPICVYKCKDKGKWDKGSSSSSFSSLGFLMTSLVPNAIAPISGPPSTPLPLSSPSSFPTATTIFSHFIKLLQRRREKLQQRPRLKIKQKCAGTTFFPGAHLMFFSHSEESSCKRKKMRRHKVPFFLLPNHQLW